MATPVVYWFHRDLRVADNPALSAAAETGKPIIPVYAFDGSEAIGGASKWWLHHSLVALRSSLERIGGRLLVRAGAEADILPRLVVETRASAVYASVRHDPRGAELQEGLRRILRREGVALHVHRGSLLFDPDGVRTRSSGPFRVFTPYYRACLSTRVPSPAAAPVELPAPDPFPAGRELANLQLLPSAPDWAEGLREAWSPGEAGAEARLDEFLGGPVSNYGTDRDRPDLLGVSRLSPHLHFGEISPGRIWREALRRAGDGDQEVGREAFLRQLVWREFSYHLMRHQPDIQRIPMRSEFGGFPWRVVGADLRAWRAGRTGYPFVDAGMRELRRTGWMHNRLRMVVASFLTKHLMIDWRVGASWFLDNLVDADLANNSANWQWVAGCGADAAPYFRIFNPVLQGAKFDPEGRYVRRWVPELTRLPDRYIHAPWTTPAEALKAADVALGSDYPNPIVEHAAARRRALDARASLKG